MYLEYLVRLIDAPAGVFTPQNARTVLGMALQQSGEAFPSVLFGHEEGGGNVQTLYSLPGDHLHYAAPPMVAVSGGSNFLRLTAVGPQGCDALREHVARVAQAVGKFTGHLYSIATYSGKVEIEPSRPTLYQCSALILQKNTKHLIALMKNFPKDDAGRWNVDFGALIPTIEKSLVRGMIGQALHLDHQMPDGESLFGRMPSDERLAIKVLEGTTYFYRTEKHRGLALAIRNLVFTMDVKLSGPWSAGQLRSRGFGAIRQLAASRPRGDE